MRREGRSNDLPQKEQGSIVPERFFCDTGVAETALSGQELSLSGEGDDDDFMRALLLLLLLLLWLLSPSDLTLADTFETRDRLFLLTADNLLAVSIELAISFAQRDETGEKEKWLVERARDNVPGDKDAGFERSSGAS